MKYYKWLWPFNHIQSGSDSQLINLCLFPKWASWPFSNLSSDEWPPPQQGEDDTWS